MGALEYGKVIGRQGRPRALLALRGRLTRIDCRSMDMALGAKAFMASNEPASQQTTTEDPVKELVWILRRMMYMFIGWAETKYGWKRAQRDD